MFFEILKTPTPTEPWKNFINKVKFTWIKWILTFFEILKTPTPTEPWKSFINRSKIYLNKIILIIFEILYLFLTACFFPIHYFSEPSLHTKTIYRASQFQQQAPMFHPVHLYSEAVVRRCSAKGIFKNFEKFTGKPCATVSFLIKLQA